MTLNADNWTVMGSSSPAKPERKMTVMPSNCAGFNAGYLFGKHPGRLAHLHSVDRLA